MLKFLTYLDSVDRRIIYLFIAVALTIPIANKIRLQPAPMETAESFFDQVDKLKPTPGKIALIAADWGPSTKAENMPQTLAAMEHLMRKRVPFALISLSFEAKPFLDSMPLDLKKVLEKEMPDQKWEYGVDWVNLGFKPNGWVMIQGLAKSKDIKEYLQKDAYGFPLDGH